MKIRWLLADLRFMFADYIYLVSSKNTQLLLQQDMARILKWEPKESPLLAQPIIRKLNYCLDRNKEFRNIFYYRTQKSHCILTRICKIICFAQIPTLEIGGKIDGGLYISHLSSIIYPKCAGKNFRVGPGCVIGRNSRGFPVIGDNVYIGANSSVIGNITIGNNVIVGAGSVVTKDLPGNAVYAGNPAKFIKNINDNKELLNEIL